MRGRRQCSNFRERATPPEKMRTDSPGMGKAFCSAGEGGAVVIRVEGVYWSRLGESLRTEKGRQRGRRVWK